MVHRHFFFGTLADFVVAFVFCKRLRSCIDFVAGFLTPLRSFFDMTVDLWSLILSTPLKL